MCSNFVARYVTAVYVRNMCKTDLRGGGGPRRGDMDGELGWGTLLRSKTCGDALRRLLAFISISGSGSSSLHLHIDQI